MIVGRSWEERREGHEWGWRQGKGVKNLLV